MDSFQITFFLFQILETRQEVVSEADGDEFFQRNASVAPPASGNDASCEPSANPFPSDIWPQQGETRTKALILALLSAKEG